MKGPPLGPGGEDISWPNQVAPRGPRTSSTRKVKPQTSNLGILAPRFYDFRPPGQGDPLRRRRRPLHQLVFYMPWQRILEKY